MLEATLRCSSVFFSLCYHNSQLHVIRNGTIKTVTDIIGNLNRASLDPQTGNIRPRPHCLRCFARTADSHAEVVIAPPSIFLLLAREQLRKEIEVAAQNFFDKPNGAFTGEISAEQLKDSGVGWALAGHSERRVVLGENDEVSEVFSNKSQVFGLDESSNLTDIEFYAEDVWERKAYSF